MSVDKSQFRKLVDVPQWEHLKPTSIGLGGTATSASAWASAGDATINENIYMVDRTRLSTYNAKTDSWYRLPPFAGGAYGNDILFTSIKYLKNDGIHGRIISATSTTFTTSGLNGKILNNLIIKIVSGKGAGQERKIISIEDPVIHEQGVSSTTPYITDTTKKWKTNQWLGYQVAVKFGEAIVPSTFLNMGNRSSVLYNSSTILFFYDPVTTMKYEPYISGYNTGNGCEYFIESSVFTIDKKWDIIPDISSRYVIYCGALFTNSISKFTAGGTVRNYNYLVFRDLIRNEVEPTTITYNFFNQPQTPNTCEHICPSSTPYFTGSITSATNRVLRFSSNLTSSLDRWVNYEVQIISGSGFGQKRRIIANTTASLEVIPNWNITPGTGSKFSVVNEDKNIYLVGGGIAGMWCFNKDVFYSHPSPFCDYGTNHPLGVRRSGEDSLPFYMDNYNGVRSTNGITSVNSIPTAKGTGYGVGDELTISGGNNGKVYVETIGVGGTVESVSLLRCGDSYSTGTGKATTGGTGTGCTIEIVTIGTIGRVSVRFMHNFRLGDTIIFSGASEAAWNKSYTVLATDSYSTFDIEITATATATNASSVDYGKIVDTTKNWVTNEHVGKLVTFSPISSNRTYTSRIISNTSKVLRLSDANIYPELSSIYIISEPYVFGRDEQYKGYNKTNYGYATSGSKITLIDNTKNWNNNQWANCKFRKV